MPRKEQVLVLRRLIYGCGDTLLIAATGWGKSLIFHAYTVLTGKTTIQIIPLKKLGAEQLDDITKLGCTQPCLVTSDSKKVEKDLLTRIKSGEFNHILLSPYRVENLRKPLSNALCKKLPFHRIISLLGIILLTLIASIIPILIIINLYIISSAITSWRARRY